MCAFVRLDKICTASVDAMDAPHLLHGFRLNMPHWLQDVTAMELKNLPLEKFTVENMCAYHPLLTATDTTQAQLKQCCCIREVMHVVISNNRISTIWYIPSSSVATTLCAAGPLP